MDGGRESDTIDAEDGERCVCPNSRELPSASKSASCDSSEDSEMMGGSVEKPGPARGDERHGRVCIRLLGGDHDIARTVRPCVEGGMSERLFNEEKKR